MKKSIFTFVLISASVFCFAQAKIAIGIKGGPNFANINTDASAGQNYKNRTGLHLGAYALFRGEKVGFQPEILFSQQGSTISYSGQPDIKSNFSYVNIPLIVKLYTVAGINIQAGPQFGFLTSAERDNVDVKDQLKTADMSLALGLGWDLPFGLSIDGRYNWGLSDINSGADVSSIKNQVWQFSVGFKLLKFGSAK